MKITVWGARGSIPVSGKQYLKYGGDTTCIEIETKNGDTVILDAGTGLRALGNKLWKAGKRNFHFMITHSHWDHLMGFPFFKPLHHKGVHIHFHGCTFAQQSIKNILKETLRAPFFPVDLQEVPATLIYDDTCLSTFEAAGLKVISVPLCHPNQGYGFLIDEDGKRLAFFPDNELDYPHKGGRTFAEYAQAFTGTDVLIHDAEYLPEEYAEFAKGWGHSVYSDTVRLGSEAGVKRLILWHLNQERTDEQADAMQAQARAVAKNGTQCDMAYTGMSFEL
ncbi:MAG: MBL fold metallo-hydrolase [Elusimicrobiota bacterium]